MTKIPDFDATKWQEAFEACKLCKSFVFYKGKYIGTCKHVKSDHRAHILHMNHCACDFWEKAE